MKKIALLLFITMPFISLSIQSDELINRFTQAKEEALEYVANRKEQYKNRQYDKTVLFLEQFKNNQNTKDICAALGNNILLCLQVNSHSLSAIINKSLWLAAEYPSESLLSAEYRTLWDQFGKHLSSQWTQYLSNNNITRNDARFDVYERFPPIFKIKISDEEGVWFSEDTILIEYMVERLDLEIQKIKDSQLYYSIANKLNTIK